MTLREVGELGHSHVEHNDHQHAKKSLHFQERIGYPGPDLIKQFMKRKNLHAKQATTLNSARYNAANNLFIIFHFYDILEKTIKELNLQHCHDLIWNCDESGLPHESLKLKFFLAKKVFVFFGHFLKACIKARISFQVFIYKKRREGSGLMVKK